MTAPVKVEGDGCRKHAMVGRMVTGDFTENTITFQMTDPYYLASGEYVIEPLSDWQARVEALAALKEPQP